jgi:hypothetical protein
MGIANWVLSTPTVSSLRPTIGVDCAARMPSAVRQHQFPFFQPRVADRLFNDQSLPFHAGNVAALFEALVAKVSMNGLSSA